tara:strand:+ start:300 stop:1244 length:945 start_codon:yes stop_codon:yes gene_type:complete
MAVPGVPFSMSDINTEFGTRTLATQFSTNQGGVGGLPGNMTEFAGTSVPVASGTFSAANFNTITDEDINASVTSNSLTLSVSNGPITVTASSNSTIQKNNTGSFASSLAFDNGNTIKIKFTSSTEYETSVTKTASMNGDSASLTVITGEDPECFEASTLILMANGTYKTLANIVVGDQVTGYTTPSMIDQGEPDWMDWTAPALVDGSNKTATVVSVNSHTHLTYYTINNEFNVTASHPLLTYKDNLWQWIIIENLAIGDILWSDEGTHVPVTSITYTETEDAAEAITVVALDVETVDTYFVKGASGTTILAHNK